MQQGSCFRDEFYKLESFPPGLFPRKIWRSEEAGHHKGTPLFEWRRNGLVSVMGGYGRNPDNGVGSYIHPYHFYQPSEDAEECWDIGCDAFYVDMVESWCTYNDLDGRSWKQHFLKKCFSPLNVPLVAFVDPEGNFVTEEDWAREYWKVQTMLRDPQAPPPPPGWRASCMPVRYHHQQPATLSPPPPPPHSPPPPPVLRSRPEAALRRRPGVEA